MMQSKNDATINPGRGKVRIRLIASLKNETIAMVVISNISTANPMKPIPKKVLLNILELRSNVLTHRLTDALSLCLVVA